MKLKLGFSPCPNDTFIFEALVHQKIDTEGFSFEPIIEDVETLNEWALDGRLDISKLSFPAFFRSLEHYTLLNAGSALGKAVGPLLINKTGLLEKDISEYRIAIPGEHTTANLLLGFAYPTATNKVPMIFSSIEDAILEEKVDLGVIIHENRFTYQERGLHKLADLGENWEQQMNLPIPLGGIAVNQSIKRSAALKINQLIRKSLEYAFANYSSLPDFVKQHSASMSEEVMRQHIDLYVNDYSLDLGETGQQAIQKLHEVFLAVNEVPAGEEEVLFL